MANATGAHVNGQVKNSSPQTKQRDDKGRFVRGNTAGAGNPFARRVAWLRAELVECLTREDVRKIAGTLIVKAQGGDIPSTKILFSYVFGKPGTWQDPDKLDLEEWHQMKEESKMAGEMPQLLIRSGPSFPLEAMRIARPVMSEKASRLLGAVCGLDPDEADERLDEMMYGGTADADCLDGRAAKNSEPGRAGSKKKRGRKRGKSRGGRNGRSGRSGHSGHGLISPSTAGVSGCGRSGPSGRGGRSGHSGHGLISPSTAGVSGCGRSGHVGHGLNSPSTAGVSDGGLTSPSPTDVFCALGWNGHGGGGLNCPSPADVSVADLCQPETNGAPGDCLRIDDEFRKPAMAVD